MQHTGCRRLGVAIDARLAADEHRLPYDLRAHEAEAYNLQRIIADHLPASTREALQAYNLVALLAHHPLEAETLYTPGPDCVEPPLTPREVTIDELIIHADGRATLTARATISHTPGDQLLLTGETRLHENNPAHRALAEIARRLGGELHADLRRHEPAILQLAATPRDTPRGTTPANILDAIAKHAVNTALRDYPDTREACRDTQRLAEKAHTIAEKLLANYASKNLCITARLKIGNKTILETPLHINPHTLPEQDQNIHDKIQEEVHRVCSRTTTPEELKRQLEQLLRELEELELELERKPDKA